MMESKEHNLRIKEPKRDLVKVKTSAEKVSRKGPGFHWSKKRMKA